MLKIQNIKFKDFKSNFYWLKRIRKLNTGQDFLQKLEKIIILQLTGINTSIKMMKKMRETKDLMTSTKIVYYS